MRSTEQEKTGPLRPIFADTKIEDEENLAAIRRRLRSKAVWRAA
jgi:hypothetical protein